jgi:hypothetical protein
VVTLLVSFSGSRVNKTGHVVHTSPNLSFTVDMVPYLRAKTVLQLNRARAKDERLAFRTKIQIARAMLEAIEPLIPDGYSVYLLCDS